MAAAAMFGAVSASPTGVFDRAASDVESYASSFWYAAMDHTGPYRGYAPHVDSASSYPVFKAVKAGDGGSIQDAINSATNGKQRNREWLASQPRVVYIPPGTYEISKTINMHTDTIIMGDATDVR